MKYFGRAVEAFQYVEKIGEAEVYINFDFFCIFNNVLFHVGCAELLDFWFTGDCYLIKASLYANNNVRNKKDYKFSAVKLNKKDMPEYLLRKYTT